MSAYIVVSEPGAHIFFGWYEIHSYKFFGKEITIRSTSEPTPVDFGPANGQISQFDCETLNVRVSGIVKSENIINFMLESDQEGFPENLKEETLDFMNELLTMSIRVIMKDGTELPELCPNELRVIPNLKLDSFNPSGKNKDQYLKELGIYFSTLGGEAYRHWEKVRVSIGDIKFTKETDDLRKTRYKASSRAMEAERTEIADATSFERKAAAVAHLSPEQQAKILENAAFKGSAFKGKID